MRACGKPNNEECDGAFSSEWTDPCFHPADEPDRHLTCRLRRSANPGQYSSLVGFRQHVCWMEHDSSNVSIHFAIKAQLYVTMNDLRLEHWFSLQTNCHRRARLLSVMAFVKTREIGSLRFQSTSNHLSFCSRIGEQRCPLPDTCSALTGGGHILCSDCSSESTGAVLWDSVLSIISRLVDNSSDVASAASTGLSSAVCERFSAWVSLKSKFAFSVCFLLHFYYEVRTVNKIEMNLSNDSSLFYHSLRDLRKKCRDNSFLDNYIALSNNALKCTDHARRWLFDSTAPNYCYVPRLIVTTTQILPQPMRPMKENRVLRGGRFGSSITFCRVPWRDDISRDGQIMSRVDSRSDRTRSETLLTPITNIFMVPIHSYTIDPSGSTNRTTATTPKPFVTGWTTFVTSIPCRRTSNEWPCVSPDRSKHSPFRNRLRSKRFRISSLMTVHMSSPMASERLVNQRWDTSSTRCISIRRPVIYRVPARFQWRELKVCTAQRWNSVFEKPFESVNRKSSANANIKILKWSIIRNRAIWPWIDKWSLFSDRWASTTSLLFIGKTDLVFVRRWPCSNAAKRSVCWIMFDSTISNRWTTREVSLLFCFALARRASSCSSSWCLSSAVLPFASDRCVSRSISLFETTFERVDSSRLGSSDVRHHRWKRNVELRRSVHSTHDAQSIGIRDRSGRCDRDEEFFSLSQRYSCVESGGHSSSARLYRLSQSWSSSAYQWNHGIGSRWWCLLGVLDDVAELLIDYMANDFLGELCNTRYRCRDWLSEDGHQFGQWRTTSRVESPSISWFHGERNPQLHQPESARQDVSTRLLCVRYANRTGISRWETFDWIGSESVDRWFRTLSRRWTIISIATNYNKFSMSTSTKAELITDCQPLFIDEKRSYDAADVAGHYFKWLRTDTRRKFLNEFVRTIEKQEHGLVRDLTVPSSNPTVSHGPWLVDDCLVLCRLYRRERQRWTRRTVEILPLVAVGSALWNSIEKKNTFIISWREWSLKRSNRSTSRWRASSLDISAIMKLPGAISTKICSKINVNTSVKMPFPSWTFQSWLAPEFEGFSIRTITWSNRIRSFIWTSNSTMLFRRISRRCIEPIDSIGNYWCNNQPLSRFWRLPSIGPPNNNVSAEVIETATRFACRNPKSSSDAHSKHSSKIFPRAICHRWTTSPWKKTWPARPRTTNNQRKEWRKLWMPISPLPTKNERLTWSIE